MSIHKYRNKTSLKSFPSFPEDEVKRLKISVPFEMLFDVISLVRNVRLPSQTFDKLSSCSTKTGMAWFQQRKFRKSAAPSTSTWLPTSCVRWWTWLTAMVRTLCALFVYRFICKDLTVILINIRRRSCWRHSRVQTYSLFRFFFSRFFFRFFFIISAIPSLPSSVYPPFSKSLAVFLFTLLRLFLQEMDRLTLKNSSEWWRNDLLTRSGSEIFKGHFR